MHLYDLPLLLPIIYQFYLEKYQGLKKEVRQAQNKLYVYPAYYKE